MKLWRLSDPCKYEYARAGRRGTWIGNPSRRVRPLIIEWVPDSDVIGDFSWPGFDSDVVVKEIVSKVFQDANVPGFELGPVQMLQDPKPGKRRSRKPRVQLPYSGPPLWDLWVTAWTQANRDRSTFNEIKRPDGSVYLELIGAQHSERNWDQQRGVMIEVMHSRVDGEGIFVPPIRGFFRVDECPAWVFCTDDVKQLIEEHGFTNVSFLEMGDTLES